jgi:hypothetical protein
VAQLCNFHCPEADDLGETGGDMGGYGSGWRGSKKDVVEDCIVLSIADFVRAQALVPGQCRRGKWSWSFDGDAEPYATIGFELDLVNLGYPSLRLYYRTGETLVDSRIFLTSTTPHFGGRRWWFRCPANGVRVGKLYLPLVAIHFASRRAHDLTYTSCQQSGQSNRFWRRLARDLGRDEAELRAIFGK